jgi:hypothetical protein
MNILTIARSAHTVFMCFCICLRTNGDFATYIKNLLIFIIEMKRVYSTVRTGRLNEAV